MKRLAAMLLALVLALSACSGGSAPAQGDKGGQKQGEQKKPEENAGKEKEPEAKVEDRELTVPNTEEFESLDYVVTDKNPDHKFNANFIDGLLENDQLGTIVGSLAEKWEGNEDKTVWTFTLRDGVKWVTNSGEEFDDVKAEDFVTGLRHTADFGSTTSQLLVGVVKGLGEYLKSDKSDEAWAKVGVKAIDDKTVQYTMEAPAPFFDSMTTYTVLYPINKEFLESMGEGCKLGAPNKKKCEFGTKKADSILYNGAFILDQADKGSKIVITKNPNYWDVNNIHLSKITFIYDDGSDQYSSIRGFEQKLYPQASLNPAWPDYDEYLEKYKDNVYNTLPNSTTFGINFNFNRKEFKHTKYASDKTLRDNTRKAVLNENFRKALRAAFDVEKYLAVSTPEEVAKAQVRNINNFPGAGTSKNGTYFDLVSKEFAKLHGSEVNLSDGQYPWVNKDEALKYIEAAKKEGVVFPIHLDVPVIKKSKRLVNQAASFAQSVKNNTDGQIIIEPVLLDKDIVNNIAFLLEDPKQADYDINTFAGWGPDYADPKSFADTFSAKNGTYLKNMGLYDGEKDKEIKDAIGLTEYTKLIEEAGKIYDNMDSRYETYAKADALLLDKAFFIPTSQQLRGQVVSKYVPFSKIWADYGTSDLKYKGLMLQDEIVKGSDREAAYQKWEQDRSNAAK